MEINPCETCTQKCGYRLFIDCPIWNDWAERMNAEQECEDNDV